ncbi:helix-turn-helix domain-containing protein [Streptomyces parvus]|uniref:helix-turn-helix domain-containing protein n=1 Tax=Streptomyces parvus TaxID=66428 RepID=UPI003827D36A
MLEIAGLSPDEESFYGLLVASGRASVSDLAERAGLTAPRTGEVLEALTTKGLASPADGPAHLYMAAAPDAALPAPDPEPDGTLRRRDPHATRLARGTP